MRREKGPKEPRYLRERHKVGGGGIAAESDEDGTALVLALVHLDHLPASELLRAFKKCAYGSEGALGACEELRVAVLHVWPTAAQERRA